MEISASVVKELREKTGLGFMICKNELIKTNGDMELAIKNLRTQGEQISENRSGKAASEGKIAIVSNHTGSMMFEVNCETDFVANSDDFKSFVYDEISTTLVSKFPTNLEDFCTLKIRDTTISGRVIELMGKIGEKIVISKYEKLDNSPTSKTYTYLHGNNKLGIIVKLEGLFLDTEELNSLGKDIAMQIAATNPIGVNSSDINPELIVKERDIYLEQVKTSGKPEKIWDRIVDGKLNKFYQEVTLLNQQFIKDTSITIKDRIKQVEDKFKTPIKVVAFKRMKVGN